MRTIRVSKGRLSARALTEAVRVLRAGGVVAFPTETAYGLAADPTNAAAVRAIYAIKGRPRSKGLPLIAASAAQARAIVLLPRSLATLAAQHWPGPLTVVASLRARHRAGYRAVAQRGSIALRVPGSAAARALAAAFGGPLTATSANRSGAGECHSGAAVRAAFRGARHAPSLLLDAGALPKRPPSTIVAVQRGKLTVLRAGSAVVA